MVSSSESVLNVPLDVDVLAPAKVRALINESLSDHDRIDDILLATSELVTNVVRYATSKKATVRVERKVNSIRVAVAQVGGSFDRLVAAADQPEGRGLKIVEAITDRWGIVGNGDVEVWFEIDHQD